MAKSRSVIWRPKESAPKDRPILVSGREDPGCIMSADWTGTFFETEDGRKIDDFDWWMPHPPPPAEDNVAREGA